MKIRYTIEGIDCPHCAAKLESSFAALPGVISAKVNFLTERATFECDDDTPALEEAILKAAHDFSKSVKMTRQ